MILGRMAFKVECHAKPVDNDRPVAIAKARIDALYAPGHEALDGLLRGLP
jgi:hypothetical protein